MEILDVANVYERFREVNNMYKFRIILKSGTEIVIIADHIELSINNLTQEITRYKFTGIKGSIPLYINLSDVSAVLQEEMGSEV